MKFFVENGAELDTGLDGWTASSKGFSREGTESKGFTEDIRVDGTKDKLYKPDTQDEKEEEWKIYLLVNKYKMFVYSHVILASICKLHSETTGTS